jgi:SpoVK/Ycf46/Vps4 family AAA+-type ATPase
MKTSDLQLVIASRLEDMAEKVKYHLRNGDHDLAELVRWEALDIAGAYDRDEEFFFVNDLTLN